MKRAMKMKLLLEMLKTPRPARSISVKKWTEKYIDPMKRYGILSKDKLGNRYIKVGKSPKISFTAHTDTVHTGEGILDLVVNRETSTIKAKDSVLGADDGVGCFLLLEMIRKKIPGLYVLFVEEESGGIGSRYAVENHSELFQEIEIMISLDRKGTGSVITHQGGERTCTDSFAETLSGELNAHGLEYAPDSTGIFTDSANFTGIIPECTNLSVGYFRAHSREEYVDLPHVIKLRESLLKMSWSNLLPENR